MIVALLWRNGSEEQWVFFFVRQIKRGCAIADLRRTNKRTIKNSMHFSFKLHTRKYLCTGRATEFALSSMFCLVAYHCTKTVLTPPFALVFQAPLTIFDLCFRRSDTKIWLFKIALMVLLTSCKGSERIPSGHNKLVKTRCIFSFRLHTRKYLCTGRETEFAL